MSDIAPPPIRHLATRVALAATGIMAVIYVIVAVVVLLVVDRNLTAAVDNRLGTSLERASAEPFRFEHEVPEVAGGPRFAPQLLLWTVHPDGTVTSPSSTAAELPEQYRDVSSPQTVSIDGTDVRLDGTTVGPDHVVVGQTMDGVSQARWNLVIAELLAAPILLGLVFTGALAVGRRVGVPIEQARRRQMEFTADASHELRTPLAVIEAQTGLALAHDREAAWYRKAFERVDVESKRMRRLVEDMLWLARFDSARGRPDAEPVDVGVLAHAAADRFATIAETKGLHLGVRVTGDTHVVVAPPEWLDRLLGVLLDNACRYTPQGGTVEVVVTADGGRERVAVEDSGPGIPPEERERIFDRFHRATERPGGAGLGLAIADAIVRATDGRWEVDASPAGGASMAVSWPPGGGRRAGSPAPEPTREGATAG